jgi:hypothetical protein
VQSEGSAPLLHRGRPEIPGENTPDPARHEKLLTRFRNPKAFFKRNHPEKTFQLIENKHVIFLHRINIFS